MDLLKKTFGGPNPLVPALDLARRGETRRVLDELTEKLKEQAREQYALKALQSVLDPMDFHTRAQLAAALMRRYGGQLSAATRRRPARYYAEECERLLCLCVDVLSESTRRLRQRRHQGEV